MPFTQTINGRVYDFSSTEVKIGAVGVAVNIQSLKYSTGLEPGELRGTSPEVQGTSVGELSNEASFTLSLEDGVILTDALGDGFGTKELQIVATFGDEGRPTIVDTLNRCRITKVDQSAESGDPLVREFELHVPEILLNGKKIWTKAR